MNSKVAVNSIPVVSTTYGALWPILRKEKVEMRLISPIEVYEAVADSYIFGVGLYLLKDLLRGKKKLNEAEQKYGTDHTPFTSIIIPTYNEPKEVVQSTIDSMLSQDYPQFEVIIADDSKVQNDYKLDGRCKVVRRNNRNGFKGGAIRNAFNYLDAKSEFVAIFDADSIIKSDVLMRFMQHFKDPKLGAIQGFIKTSANEERNSLTKYLSVISVLSNYILYGRYIRNGFVAVQGTNEVYRRSAINSIGGVAPYATVNEDLDTSFRLRLKGWKIAYDPKIVCECMAPETYKVFAGQLTRWTSSTIREYRRHLSNFLKNKEIKLKEKVDSILFLSTWTISLIVSPTLLLIPLELMNSSLPDSLPLSIAMTSLPIITILEVVTRRSNIKLAVKALGMYFWILIPGFLVSFKAAIMGMTSDGSFNVTDKGSKPKIHKLNKP